MGKQLLLLLSGMLMVLQGGSQNGGSQTQVVPRSDTVHVHDTKLIPTLVSDTATTLIVLRHAEREGAGNDPGLSAAGAVRAEEIARVLSNVPVAAIYSTPFNRTRQTVQPLARIKGIPVSEYDPQKPFPALVAEIVAAAHGRVAVIVGHSNTVPGILRELSHNAFNIAIGEQQFDNLFIVSLPDSLTPRITHLKFGKPTP
jgi:2,3-bisphosphoglycerate-dependent phosphoglycerate mutase